MSVNRTQLFTRSALLIVLSLFFAINGFGASAGVVRGKVLGPDNRPLSGVVVQLRNDITGFKQDAATTTDGTFTFNNVPYNPYELHIDVQGFQPSHAAVDVHSPVPIDQTITL